MKYIKRFNEELKPETYISAGRILKDMPGGGKKRSSPLIDYGLEKKYGFYKMHWANTSIILGKDLTFTNLRCESYFGRPDSSKIETFRYSAEDAVELWKQGNHPLCMTFNFVFQPTEETKDKMTTSSSELHQNPMFSFEIWFSNWEEGLESYNWDIDNDEPMTGDAVVDLNGLYKWTNELVIYKKKPVKMYYSKSYPYFGIFSDRASALKFKKQLNDLLEPHKEKVMELLSCVNASADDIEEYEDKINKISLNHLFSVDEKTANWFTYNQL
jgi:hypothetical protein